MKIVRKITVKGVACSAIQVLPGSMLLGACLSVFLLSSAAEFAWSGKSNPEPTDSASRAGSNDVSTSPQKLYEAVSSYIQGIHGKRDSSERKPERSSIKKWGPTSPRGDAGEDSVLRQTMATEEDLAIKRLERQEFDMAIPALERALKASVRLASSDDSARLKEVLDASRSKAQQPIDQELLSPGEMTNTIGMRLVAIRPGTFLMGSSPAEVRRLQAEWNVAESLLQPESPAHKVNISTPYLLGKYEVTLGQFKKFVSETGYRTVAEKQGWAWVYDEKEKHWQKKSGVSWRNPGTEVADDYPVSLVCHADAEAFCEWLSKKENRRYQLPTEAQWEYAARGGKESQRFPWGDDYPSGKKLNMADTNSPVPWADRTVNDGHARLAPVGSFEPNDFWLYDMMGNAWELCSDYYDAKAYEEAKDRTSLDPTGPRSGKKRIVRGGNWAFGPGIARNAFRTGIDPDLCIDMNGFRVAAALAPQEYPADHSSTKTLLTAEYVWKLTEKVKELTAKGRRLEAHKLAQNVQESTRKTKTTLDQPGSFVSGVLDAVVDLTQDNSIQSVTNSLGMKMVRIPAGSFIMGSSESDIAWSISTLAQGQPLNLENEYPFHKVRISRPFLIGATEVTVGQWRKFVEETGYITDAEDEGGGEVFNGQRNRFDRKAGSSWKNPGWTVTDNQPAVMISHNDAQAFVEWLTAIEKLPYKLPTEAQWEYAARGGLPAAQFPWGDLLPDGRRANYADKNTDFEWRDRNADDGYKYVAPVGSYEPNGFGLYDMAGNVLEWVRDYYGEDYYKFTPEVDPEGPGHGENRVTKGGEWTFGAVNLRCAFRGWSRPDLAVDNVGFRVAIELGNALHTFHFADDFLTKQWVPGPDQRAVAVAVAKVQARRPKASRGDDTRTSAQEVSLPPINGVLVISLSPKSDARKAGMAKGDVIIEFDGARDLNAEKFLALTARTRRDKTRPLVVFVRDGIEYSVRVSSGFVGVSVMDTYLKGPFKQPEKLPGTTPSDDKGKKKPLNWS